MAVSTKRPTGNDVPLTKGDVDGAASTVVNANLTASRALITNTLGKIANATTTSAEIDALRGSRSDSGATIADADRFVHNDGGSMTQTAFIRIWAWIVTKAAGAVSTILTTNLAVNRVLISSSSGKVVVASALTADRVVTSNASGIPVSSAITTTELGKLDGGATPESVQVDDDDGFLINVDGTLKQVRGDKVKEYITGGSTGGIAVLFKAWVPANTSDITIYNQNGIKVVIKKNTTTGNNPKVFLENNTGASLLYDVSYGSAAWRNSTSVGTNLAASSSVGISGETSSDSLITFSRTVVTKNSVSLTASDIATFKIFEVDVRTTDTSDGAFILVKTL